MASFTSTADAVACACAIQQRMSDDDTPDLRVRIGINAGEPIAHDRQLFGLAVNLASRLCDAADPGGVLVSDVIAALTMGKGFEYEPRGEMEFKGFSEPVRVSAVRIG